MKPMKKFNDGLKYQREYTGRKREQNDKKKGKENKGKKKKSSVVSANQVIAQHIMEPEGSLLCSQVRHWSLS
jgi:hypothetical protein